MSNYPNQLDDDVSLPRVDDNITEIGGAAINALRDSAFALEGEVGIGARGTRSSLSERLSASLDGYGNIKASALTSLGLITLPITNAQISASAGILESKLALDFSTASLNNNIINMGVDVNTALNFISNHGVKLEPHLVGSTYRHVLNQIDVDGNVNNYFKNNQGALRNNTNLYTLLSDINTDLVDHENADGTSAGTIPPNNYGHGASGIFLNTQNFSFVPQTATDLQQFAQFIDNSNIFILGTRIQTLYQGGIPRSSRSTNVTDATHGQLIVPITPATAYLLHSGSSSPVDNIDTGDDVVQFVPSSGVAATNAFDAEFSLVQIGDILTINYGPITTSFIIKEVKYIVNGSNKSYLVRIDGKNLLATINATAQINRPLFNTDKYGVLALSLAQPSSPIGSAFSSLVASNPRGAEALGNGFNPDLIDGQHYNLYLVLYPTGNPTTSSVNLAAIDISGNQGATPGQYTLESIVEATNIAFRANGFNYRFAAFSYKGNFGIMLADSFGGAAFSVISGIINTGGTYDQTLTNTVYQNNIVDIFNNKDALGFGPLTGNIATPPFSPTYVNASVAQNATRVFVPLTRKNYYVNGVERERLNIEPAQLIDTNGDGYWAASIISKNIIGTRVQVTYQVNHNLSTSSLAIGKTLVAQSESGSGSVVDFGRFFIENVQFDTCNCVGYTDFTTITVYDAIHSTGISPYVSAPVGTNVRLYFSGDSISFSSENLSDSSTNPVYKRHFEVYVNQDGYTFSHERGRMNISGNTVTVNTIPIYSSTELSNINIYKISPKLRGYSFGKVKKINLQITSFNQTTGIFSGYLCSWNGTTISHQGPVTVGKKGQTVRFYDETNVDYIDFIFNMSDSITTISSTKVIDIQLFPTLSLDDEVLLLGTCQANDLTKIVNYLKDARQFGNVSENQLSTSALDYIAAPTRLLNENGIIRGFDITQLPTTSTPYVNTLSVNGGTAIINGKVVQINNETIAIPVVQEVISTGVFNNTISWFVCANDSGELELIASTDFDPNVSPAASYNTAGVDNTRLFNVQNPNASSVLPYYVRGTYLADIVQKQKDVVIIGVVTATIALVSGSYVITSVTSSDARRYIYNGYGGLDNPFIWGDNASFRTFDALNTWLTQLTKFKSATLKYNNVGKKVIVKGNVTIASSLFVNYLEEVTFEGDGGVFTISTDVGFNIGSNVKFRNLKVDYVYDPVGSGSSFFTTANLANPGKAAFYCTVDFNTGSKNISFENCTFTTANQYHFGFIGFFLPNTNAYLENVNIVNNKFISTYAGQDKQAVITFIGPTAAPTQLTGARVVNCYIQNNQCNKNQLILLSNNLDSGSGTILDLLVGINVRIVGNTCGAINVLLKKDTTVGAYNTNFSLDKVNDVIIAGNNCRFIYSGYSTGRMIDSVNSRAVTKIAAGIYSGSLIISENTCSFIHLGVRVPTTSGGPQIVLKHNKFRAYDSSVSTGFLNDYYVGYTGPSFPQTATALIVDKVSGS